MKTSLDSRLLPVIDQALAAPGWLLPIPVELRAAYDAEQLAQRRPHNRRVMVLMMVFFDLFLLAQLKSAPEIVPLSAILRLLVLTPAVLVFAALDHLNRLGRLYGPYLVSLAVMAGVISAVLTVLTHASTATNMSDIRATPLVLLSTGLIARLTPLEVISNAVISVVVFAGSIIIAPSVPRAEIGSLILTDLAIGVAAVVFNLQLEWRDRRVFLLNISQQIGRAELAALNRGLLEETQTDGLTGVANRRCFDETLEGAWGRALETSTPLGLILMDIDRFKDFNDTYGHQGGDACLRRVALQARGEVRTSDLFARYGGEEFAVILPGATLKTVLEIAERMRVSVVALGLPHAAMGNGAVVSVSLGAASVVPSKIGDVGLLVEAADSSLYTAKRMGRNRICPANMESV